MALTKKQLAARALGIGASEIAALAGLSRWQTPIDIYMRKVEGETGQSPSLAAKLGDLLEEPIAKLAAEQLGVFLRRVGTLNRPERPFALATPDRAMFATREARGDSRAVIRFAGELAEATGLLQVKHTTMRLRYEWGEPGTDAVPAYYYPQGIWECGVSMQKQVTFAVLFDKHEFGLWPIVHRPELFEALYEIGERFFVDHVLARKPPPPDASDRYADFLNSKFPTSNGQIVTPSEELEAKILEWAMLKACKDRAETLAKQLGNEIKTALGSDYGFAGPRFGKVLWIRPQPSSATDWKAATNELLQLVPKLAEATDPATRSELLTLAQGIVAKHTAPKFNAPKLSPYFGKSPAGTFKRQTLKLDLPALEAGEKENDEQSEEQAHP